MTLESIQTLTDFEQQILGNVVDLSSLTKGETIKSPEERRREFLLKRRGKFTASEIHRLVTAPTKRTDLPVGAKTYCLEKAVECLTEFDDSEAFVSYEMKWGIDHEIEALETFAEMTQLSVHKTGPRQETIIKGDLACTPDGLIVGRDIGVEVKCPKSKTHFEYLGITNAEQLKAIAPEYYWQVMFSMMIIGYPRWYFISYDPRFISPNHRLHYATIEFNPEDVQFLLERTLMAIEYRNDLLHGFRG